MKKTEVLLRGRKMKIATKAIFVILILCIATPALAQDLWKRADTGLTIHSGNGIGDPKFFTFNNTLYLADNTILSPDYVPGSASLYSMGFYCPSGNCPILNLNPVWNREYTPPDAMLFKPIVVPSQSEYLYATAQNALYFISKTKKLSSSNWIQVQSNGIENGKYIVPMINYKGYLYAAVYSSVTDDAAQDTFDIYRSPDIGYRIMQWERVVKTGFQDVTPNDNHRLGTMIPYNGKLIAITDHSEHGVFGDTRHFGKGIQVWQSMTGKGDWGQINLDGFTNVAGGRGPQQEFGSAIVDSGYLYVGTRSGIGAGIFRYDGTGSSGWKDVSDSTIIRHPTRYESMVIYNSKLYEAQGYPLGLLYRYDGLDPVNGGGIWTIIIPFTKLQIPGGEYIAPFSPENCGITSLTTYDGILFAATTNGCFTKNKGGEIWGSLIPMKVISPNGGENWMQRTSQTITWNYNEALSGSLVKIELLKGTVVNRVLSSSHSLGSGGTGQINWLVPFNQVPGTDYKIRISDTSNAAYTDTSDATFTISAGPPITVVVPNGGENWRGMGSTHTIRWSYTGSPGSSVKIELLKGTAVNRVIIPSISIGVGGSGYYGWQIPSSVAPGTNYKIRITSTSNAAYTDTSNSDFTITN